MNPFKVRRFGWWILAIFFMMTLSPACSSRNIIPAKDIKSIIGKWEGYGYSTKMSDKFHMGLQVRGDGKWLMSMDTPYLSYGRVQEGVVWVEDDKFIMNCATPGLNGTAELHSSGGTLWLMYRSSDGLMRADLTLVY